MPVSLAARPLMTHEELAARYRLIAKSQSDGIESWDAVESGTEQEVNVHRLVTSRQISILDMIAHIDPAERARIIEQLVVDDVPVVVTEPLPQSTTFIEWLQNSIPSTVTAVIRPLARPQQTDSSSAASSVSATNDPTPAPVTVESTASRPVDPRPVPTVDAPEGLTAIFASEFLALEKEAAAVKPSEPKTNTNTAHVDAAPSRVAPPAAASDANEIVDAVTTDAEGRTPTPPTPLANLVGGLTEIFSASDLLQKLAPETVAKRATVPPPTAPVPTPPPPPIRPIQPPPILKENDNFQDDFQAEAGLVDEIPDFRSETPLPGRTEPVRDDETLDSEPPDFRTTFFAPPEPRPAPARPPRLEPPPQLGSRQSPYTEIIEPRRIAGMPAKPALIAPPAPTRQPSILPVVIVVSVLVLAIVATIVIIALH